MKQGPWGKGLAHPSFTPGAGARSWVAAAGSAPRPPPHLVAVRGFLELLLGEGSWGWGKGAAACLGFVRAALCSAAEQRHNGLFPGRTKWFPVR